MLLSQIAAQHKLSDNDKAILDNAVEIQCDRGIKVEVDPHGEVWACASMRWNRCAEHLGRVDNREGFLAHFRARYRTGSA